MAGPDKSHAVEVRKRIIHFIAIVFFGILIDISGVLLSNYFDLPFKFRSAGTITSTVFGGYIAGIISAGLMGISGGFKDYTLFSYGFLYIIDALISYWFYKKGFFYQFRKALLTIPVLAIIPAVFSNLISDLLGNPFNPLLKAFGYELAEKTVSVLLAYFFLNILPDKFQLKSVSLYQKMDCVENRVMSLRTKLLIVISILCVMLSGSITWISYVQFKYELVNEHVKLGHGAIELVKSRFDADMTDEYIKNGDNSEEYVSIEEYLYDLKENYPDMQYIYIYRFYEDDIEVVFDLDTHEWEGDKPGDRIDYEPILLLHKDEFLTGNEVEPTISKDKYGYLLSVYAPVVDSSGKTACYACVDFSMDVLKRSAKNYIVRTISMIVGFILFIFAVCLKIMDKNIITPVNEMAYCAGTFSFSTDHARKGNLLRIKDLKIRTGDEIENLYQAFTKTVEESNEYFENLRIARSEMHDMEEEVSRISEEASTDALTGVKNKKAYQKIYDELSESISRGNAQFAIVMVDLNHLKKINDTYGHEKGDYYIKGSCHMICEIFKNSPVFRFGGDEFVIVLTGKSYHIRDVLMAQINAAFINSSETEGEPWECFSAAAGLAEYVKGSDESVDDVFKRADDEMYRNKLLMKAQRTD